MNAVKEGIITKFDILRGFGFIAVVGEADYFLHISAIVGRITPAIGQKVRFKDGGLNRPGNKRAIDVTLLTMDGTR